MNPQIDLNLFRGGRPATSADVPGAARPAPVGPPRRLFTRVVLPGVIFAAAAGLGLWVAGDALTTVRDVTVAQPVVAAGATGATPAAPGDTSTSPTASASAPPGGAAPLFQAPGWIEPDPSVTMVSALSMEPATINAVLAREGDTVSAGQTVATLEPGELAAAVRKAEAALATRRAELAAARAAWDNPISATEAVATAEAEQARLAADQTRLARVADLARRQAEVSRSLGARSAGGWFQAEKAALESRAAEAATTEAAARISSHAATLTAARRRLELRLDDRQRLAMAEAQADEADAALALARLRLARCDLKAPAAGTVMRVFAHPGMMVSGNVENGQRVMSLYDPARLQVRAEVPLADSARARPGLAAEIRVEALPDRVFRGVVSRTGHEADIQRNSLPVKVRVIDPDPALRPEMVARVTFVAGGAAAVAGVAASETSGSTTATPATATPDGPGLMLDPAIQPRDGALWTVGPDRRTHRRAVTLGPPAANGLRPVISGLKPTDKIIHPDPGGLTEGARVRITGAGAASLPSPALRNVPGSDASHPDSQTGGPQSRRGVPPRSMRPAAGRPTRWSRRRGRAAARNHLVGRTRRDAASTLNQTAPEPAE